MADDQTSPEPDDRADDTPSADDVIVVRAAELFAGRREVWIDHNGERYRLRVTRRGRLILQK